SWLTVTSEGDLNAEIAEPGQFAVHLFGHMHEPWLSVVASGGSEPRILSQGRSLFGMDFFLKDKKQHGRLHGCSAGRIELSGNNGSLTFWPREARLLQGDQW